MIETTTDIPAKKEHFPDFIGQEAAKRQLSEMIDTYEATQYFPHTLIYAKRGNGKTHICEKTCRALKGSDGKLKQFITANGAGLGRLSSFIDTIVQPLWHGDMETTLFIDEIHYTNKEILNWLLSPLAPCKSNKTEAHFKGTTYEFNFNKLSFLCATTNAERLSEPFKSRLKRVELGTYKEDDLVKILYSHLGGIEFKEQVEYDLVSTVRGSPRETVMRAKDIYNYLSKTKNATFGRDDWAYFRKQYNIKPLGLTSYELELLRYLSNGERKTLRNIAARLGLDTGAVQRDTEPFLISHNLLDIDGLRGITDRGQEILREHDMVFGND